MPTEWLLEMGHSRLKLCRRQIDSPGAVESVDLERFPDWLAGVRPGPEDRFWIAAVPLPQVKARVTAEIERAGPAWTEVTTGSAALPVAASYPGMGVDRWLAIQPVWTRLRAAFCLADCGTATTVDLIDARGIHLGGWIMPGADAAREGLLARAPGLRRSLPTGDFTPGPARDTAEAIEHGLLLQQAGGIALAHRIAAGLPEFGEKPPLVLTGGGAGPLQSLLEGARVEPDLVLHGLAMAADSLSNG